MTSTDDIHDIHDMTSTPPDEYGPWVRGNAGTLGRVVVRYVPCLLMPGEFMPVADWEDAPLHVVTESDESDASDLPLDSS